MAKCGRKIGSIPWNKGKKGVMPIPWNKGTHIKTNTGKTHFKKGIIPWNTGLKGFLSGVNHWNWKGNDVQYPALHTWVKRELGKPEKCEHCGSLVNLQWASVSHKAKRDINDYISLCQKCHCKYDDYVNKGWRTRREKQKW